MHEEVATAMGKIQSTYQHKLFNDEELKLPDHDSIVRWADRLVRDRPCALLDLLNIGYCVDEGGAPHSWHTWPPRPNLHGFWGPQPEGLWKRAQAAMLAAAPSQPLPPLIEVSPPVWEPIVKNQNGTMVGANDLSVTITKYSLELVADIRPDCEITNLRWDHSAAVVTHVVFEAKTRIPAVGELLRQIQFYRTHLPKSVFVVIAPSSEFRGETRQILKEQKVIPLDYLANI